MPVHIRLRRDTAANWTATNPVLLLGEAGIETDTKKWKVGDGATVWNSLGYFRDTSGLALLAGATFIGNVIVPAETYSSGWNGSNEVPTKNDVYDKIETVVGGIPGSYTDENAQDAIGTILTDTNDIDLTYNDATPLITADLKATAISAKSSAAPLDGTEEVLLNDSGTLKKATTQQVANLAALARTTVQKTTASLADLAEETGTVALGKTAIVTKVVADRECRIRLYPTSALRTADSSRALGTAVADGSNEPLLEIVPVAGDLNLWTFDTPTVYNGDGSPTSNIYYAIQNRSGSTGTVTVTFTVLILEN